MPKQPPATLPRPALRAHPIRTGHDPTSNGRKSFARISLTLASSVWPSTEMASRITGVLRPARQLWAYCQSRHGREIENHRCGETRSNSTCSVPFFIDGTLLQATHIPAAANNAKAVHGFNGPVRRKILRTCRRNHSQDIPQVASFCDLFCILAMPNLSRRSRQFASRLAVPRMKNEVQLL